MTTWPDEYIDHWGEVYQRHRAALAERGVTFAVFLLRPRHFLSLLHSGAVPAAPLCVLSPRSRVVARGEVRG